MADIIQWIDGFDHYTVGQGSRKYNAWNLTTNMATGRNGSGQAAVCNIAGYRMQKSVSSSQAWRIGFGFKAVVLGTGTTSICRLLDAGVTQCEIQITAGGNLQIARNGTLVGSAGTTALSGDTWYHIEWYASIKDSITSGNCRLYINGVLEINLAGGSDIKNTANFSADAVYLGTSASGWTIHYDDFVISTMDDTTTPTMLGDCSVITMYPNGNGNYSQFDGSDGNSTDNYLLVDESLLSDTDYVSSDVSGERDSYAMSNPSPSPSSVKAVQISANVRRDDAGAKTCSLFTRSGSTDYDGTAFTPSTSFEIRSRIMETNPATGSAWTASNLDALEVGIKLDS